MVIVVVVFDLSDEIQYAKLFAMLYIFAQRLGMAPEAKVGIPIEREVRLVEDEDLRPVQERER